MRRGLYRNKINRSKKRVNLLNYGHCDEIGAVGEWNGVDSTLSISSNNPKKGAGALRITNTAVNGRAQNSILTIGKTYRWTGWARGDGTAYPKIFSVAAIPAAELWIGTSSTEWQWFDVEFTAGDVRPRMYCTGPASNWVEFDEMIISEEG